MVVDLSPTPDKHHLLLRLKDKLTSEKTFEKRSRMKVVGKVVVGESKSSSDFDHVLEVDYSVPLKKIHKKPNGSLVPMFCEIPLFLLQ